MNWNLKRPENIYEFGLLDHTIYDVGTAQTTDISSRSIGITFQVGLDGKYVFFCAQLEPLFFKIGISNKPELEEFYKKHGVNFREFEILFDSQIRQYFHYFFLSKDK